jgi:hypothetical protein
MRGLLDTVRPSDQTVYFQGVKSIQAFFCTAANLCTALTVFQWNTQNQGAGV